MPLARQLRILYVGCLDGLLAERKPEPSPVTRGVEDHARRVQTASLPFTRVEARPVGTGRVRHFRTHCSKQGLSHHRMPPNRPVGCIARSPSEPTPPVQRGVCVSNSRVFGELWRLRLLAFSTPQP